MGYLKNKKGSLESSIISVWTEAAKKVDEKLVGGQKKLDKDKDGDIDGKDFAMLRKEKGKKKVDELTKAQKKLPPALQKAILKKDKMKKEELDKDDEGAVKKVKDMLKKASQAHASQAKVLDADTSRLLSTMSSRIKELEDKVNG